MRVEVRRRSRKPSRKKRGSTLHTMWEVALVLHLSSLLDLQSLARERRRRRIKVRERRERRLPETETK